MVDGSKPLDDGPLPLVVTVGFTGHRTLADPAAARRKIDAALAEIGRAFDLVVGATFARAFHGTPALRLLVGAAPGADRMVAEAWRAAALGEVHMIYPFREPGGGDPFSDDPAKHDPATRIAAAPEGPWTGIDATNLGLAQQQAHAEVGRWIVRHADVLACWWDGEPGRGAGGTNDTILRALERGLPVVWLGPGDMPSRLIDPDQSHPQADAAEAIADLASIAQPLSATSLAAWLGSDLTPPGDPATRDPEVVARIDYDAHDPLLPPRGPLGPVRSVFNRTLWRSFSLFQKLAGRAGPAAPGGGPPPADIAAQPGFARLTAATAEASARADLLSSIHRSEQLLLILIAILAVFVGALPALVVSSPGFNFHLYAATIELILGLVAFTVAWAARRAHRHRRWSDARRLAERLRGVLATWPLGFDIADAHADPPQTWTEWRTRALLRAAGPRRGWIDRACFEATARWATATLLDSQVAYHARQHRMAETIERRMQGIENGAFGLLMATLASFITLSLLEPWTHWAEPHWFGGLVTVVSAVSPAVGAGCIAMDATNGFGELALHSARLKDAFEALRARVPSGGPIAYHPFHAIIRRGAELLVEDADAWRDRLARRRIVRGG
jgi:hypothetical protein